MPAANENKQRLVQQIISQGNKHYVYNHNSSSHTAFAKKNIDTEMGFD